MWPSPDQVDPYNPPQPELAANSASARPISVDAYLAPLYRAKPDDKAVQDYDALFTLKDFDFTELIPTWFDVIERVGPVVGMLLGQRYIGRSFVENRLITAVAAAEGLHRRLLGGETYLPGEQFDKMIEALVDAVQPEHVEWLKARLWNELSLKQRLMQLADRAGGDVIRPFLPKPNRWARTTTNARNVLVHRFEEDEGEPLTNSAMYALAEMTSCVITLVLLRELGLNNDQLSRLGKENRSFRWIAEKGPRYVPSVFGVSSQHEKTD